MNNAFRPQSISKRYRLRQYICTGRHESYNWMSRVRWYRDSDKNRKHLVRTAQRLHYLGSHAPLTIRKKWSIIEQQFLNRRMPKNASFRYNNEISSGRWL